MDIKIEGGVVKLKDVPNSWLYTFTTVEGILKVVFIAAPDQTPEIGDFIVDGVLKKREGLQVNSDTSRWQRKMRPKTVWGN